MTSQTDARLEEIENRLQAIARSLSSQSPRRSRLTLLEKIIVPVVGLLVTASLSYLAIQTDRASTRLQEAQLEIAAANRDLARAEAERLAQEAKTAKQLKYIDLIYEGLRSSRPVDSVSVLALLQPLDPDAADTLLRAIDENPLYPEEVRAEAAQLRRWGPLANYDLVIYVDRADSVLRSKAERIRRSIASKEYPNDVTVALRDGACFARVGRPRWRFTIRFEEPYERPAAERLQQVLKSVFPMESFVLVPTVQASSDTLTLFLFDEA